MAKYHLNPFSGEPSICKATKSKCPWGGESGEENHFLTREAAQAAYEMRMKEEEIAAVQRKAADRILDYERRQREVEEERRRLADAAKPPEERGYLSAEATDTINTDGIRCPSCGEQLNPRQAALILDESQWTSCRGCGKSMDLYNIDLKVGETKDTFAAYDKAKVYELVWHHSTKAEDWEEWLAKDNGFYAHLGSEQAAFDRAIAEKNYVEGEGGSSQGFWLYEVKVEEGSKVADTILLDGNEDYMEYHEGNKARLPISSRESEVDLDVIRYFNKWEDMASISLVANSHKLKVIGKRFVPKEEAAKSLSLYNVDPLEAKKEELKRDYSQAEREYLKL